MSEEKSALDALVEITKKMHVIEDELRKLREIEEWALGTLPFKAGDKVVIDRTVDVASSSGWYSYREVLVKGRTGRVNRIFLSGGQWYCSFAPDDVWSISNYPPGEIRRYDAKGSVFCMRVSSLRKRKKKDKRLPVPDLIKSDF